MIGCFYIKVRLIFFEKFKPLSWSLWCAINTDVCKPVILIRFLEQTLNMSYLCKEFGSYLKTVIRSQKSIAVKCRNAVSGNRY